MSLDLLFSDDDRIFICNVDEHGTTNEFVGNVAEVQQALTIMPRNFYCINPVKNNRRTKSELARYNSFLFESDSLPIEQQFAMLPKIVELGIVRMATYSGGKSIHYIVSAADDLQIGEPGSDTAEARYKNIWLGLASILTSAGLEVDRSGKNPAVLSRLPGMFRAGNNLQTLLHNGNLINSKFLRGNALNINNANKGVRTENFVTSYEQLEALLNDPKHHNLALNLKYPNWINERNGNYNEILKKTYWAIDEVGATYETFLAYFEKYTVPHLKAKNYHDNWEIGIYHAFKKKGLV